MQRRHWFIGGLVCLVAALVIDGAASEVAQAAKYPFNLVGGVGGRQHWNYPGNINPIYAQIANESVASWNGIGRISFSLTTDFNSSQADFYGLDYGNTTWAGVTAHRLLGGAGVNPALGAPPQANWDYAEISLNDYHLKDAGQFSYNKVRAVAAHEFGHGVGIDHFIADSERCQLLHVDHLAFWTVCGGKYTPQSLDRSVAETLP